jgi:hypothetical protein
MIRIPTLLLGCCLPLHAEVATLAHPEQPLPADRTVVWSPMFQAAWDQLKTWHGGPAVKVDPPNPLIAKLDGFRWDSEKVMPAGGWGAWAITARPSSLDEVNAGAAKLLGLPKGPFTLANDDGLSFYGVLARSVEFHDAFHRSRKKPLSFTTAAGAKEVHFFGSSGETSAGYGDSVRVLAWRPVDKSHALQIRGKADDDTVILYLPPTGQDFATACRWLRTWRGQYRQKPRRFGAWNDVGLHEKDVVQVPYLKLEAIADFTPQLHGSRTFKGFGIPWQIAIAEQRTRFELHEKGARVEVLVEGGDEPFGGPPEPRLVPRHFIYDRPFFVFLWRDKAEWPYFGAWIGDASGMVPWK